MRTAVHPPARRRTRSFVAGLWLACTALAGVLLMPCTPAMAQRGAGMPVAAHAAVPPPAPAVMPCPAHAHAGSHPSSHPGPAPQAPATGADTAHAHGPAQAPAPPTSCCATGGCAWMAVGTGCAPEVGVPATAAALPPTPVAVAFVLPPTVPVGVPAHSRAPPPPPRPDVLLL